MVSKNRIQHWNWFPKNKYKRFYSNSNNNWSKFLNGSYDKPSDKPLDKHQINHQITSNFIKILIKYLI